MIRASCNNASLHKHASTENTENDTSEVLQSIESIQAKPGPVSPIHLSLMMQW